MQFPSRLGPAQRVLKHILRAAAKVHQVNCLALSGL